MIDALDAKPPLVLLRESTAEDEGEDFIKGIRKRPDGRWEGRYLDGGKAKSVYARTFDECKKLYREAYRNRTPGSYHRRTLNDWYQEWLTLYKIPRLADNSVKRIKETLSKYVLPTLGNKELVKINPIQLQRVINAIPYPRQKEVTARNLNNLFNKAWKVKLLSDNPMTAVEYEKAQSESWNALTLQQESAFLKRIENHRYRFIYLFFLCTGLRLGEALAIRWSDIDLSKRIIQITASKSTTGELSTTKTKKKRQIPLTQSIEWILENLKNDSDFIITAPRRSIELELKTITQELNFERIVVHSFRHTYATRCLEAGVHIKVLSSWLGHAALKMTTDLYTTVQQELSAEEAKKINIQFDPNL